MLKSISTIVKTKNPRPIKFKWHKQEMTYRILSYIVFAILITADNDPKILQLNIIVIAHILGHCLTYSSVDLLH